MRPLPSWYCTRFKRTCRYSKHNRRMLWIRQRHRVQWPRIRKVLIIFRLVGRVSLGKVRYHSRFLLQLRRATILQDPRFKDRSKPPRKEILLSLRHLVGFRESISSWTIRWILLKNNLCPSRIWTPLTAIQHLSGICPSFQTSLNLSLLWNPRNKWLLLYFPKDSSTMDQKILLQLLALQEVNTRRLNAIRSKKATHSKVRLRNSGAI